MKCVVLAGGGGLRLWPLSRQQYPKQFLKMTDEHTMFQETILRNLPYCDDFMIITNDSFRFIVEKQLDEINLKRYTLLLEGVGRNTAPAITLAAMYSQTEELLFVVPADAKINCGNEYEKAIVSAKQFALDNYLVTFGIEPVQPHTGYGYIKHEGYDVISFQEKPDLLTAEAYIESGNYLWNSGMFLFKANVMLNELVKYRKDIFDQCFQIKEQLKFTDRITLPKSLLDSVVAESIDYAVMEKSKKMKVIPSSFSWNDVGGLEALSDYLIKDETGNGISSGDVIVYGCKNTQILNDTRDQIVVANCVENLLVVNTNDAVYISTSGHSQNIKKIIEEYSEKFGQYFEANIKTYRPWGYYEVLVNEAGYKVKRLTIYPHKRLSLQKHQYRSEHWTVVKGEAVITLGEETAKYLPNQTAYIPIGEIHRVSNEMDTDIIIIEVAVGDPIIEEDIIRIEDDFLR